MSLEEEYGELAMEHVGTTCDGHAVFVVKRPFRGGAQASYGAACGTHYWTVVVQTMPGKRKLMAADHRRFYGNFRADDDRKQAVTAAGAYLTGYAAESALGRL